MSAYVCFGLSLSVRVLPRSFSAVRDIDVSTLPSFGYSKFVLPDEELKGMLEFKFLGHPSRGVAVNLDSAGYKVERRGEKGREGRGGGMVSLIFFSCPCVCVLKVSRRQCEVPCGIFICLFSRRKEQRQDKKTEKRKINREGGSGEEKRGRKRKKRENDKSSRATCVLEV